MTRIRLIGAVDAIAVDGARAGGRHVAMPDFIGVFWKVNARDLPASRGIEHTKLKTLGISRKHSEICTQTIPGSPERIRAAAIKLRW